MRQTPGAGTWRQLLRGQDYGRGGISWDVRISRRTLFVALVCRLCAEEVKFSTGVDLVTLLATVRDAHGLLARNLTRDDFLLEEDGVPQTIRYFSRESDLPLTVGLLVDTSQSQVHVLEPERRASYAFLDQVIREDQDQAFVGHFDVRVEVLQGFTSSRKDLALALGQQGSHRFVHASL
jgi:VWFA-related protein